MNDTTSETPRAGHRRGRLGPWVVALLAVALTGLILVIPRPQAPVVEPNIPPVNVTTWVVVPEVNLPDRFVLPAVAEPNRVVTLTAEVDGRVEQIARRKGRLVQEGELLVRLNTDLLRPQLKQAQAQLDRYRLDYARMQQLVEQQATSRSDLDNAVMNVTVAEAQVAAIQARLDRCRITAPWTGVLNDLPVEVGQYVQPGTAVAGLVETAVMKVTVDLPERDVPFFAPGRQATVLWDGPNRREVRQGTIRFLSAVADPQTRTSRLEIAVPNPDGQLHSGQVVRVELTRRILSQAIMIPLAAVIPMEDSKAVYVVQNGTAQRRTVTLGMIRGDRVQILEGLHGGEELIVAGHRFVAPGQPVRVVETRAPQVTASEGIE